MSNTSELTHLFRELKAPAAARALPKPRSTDSRLILWWVRFDRASGLGGRGWPGLLAVRAPCCCGVRPVGAVAAS
jgi:hypothetical protein